MPVNQLAQTLLLGQCGREIHHRIVDQTMIVKRRLE